MHAYRSYVDIVRCLRLFKLSVKSVEVVVRTHFIDNVLSYAAQEDFDPEGPIRVYMHVHALNYLHGLLIKQVRFAGELGIDAGGVTREFFTLLESSVKRTYIDNMGCFTHNICALHVSCLQWVIIIAWVVIILNLGFASTNKVATNHV